MNDESNNDKDRTILLEALDAHNDRAKQMGAHLYTMIAMKERR